MSPNSRPPLTSRIRASFEGKRKTEVTSPITNDFVTQDPVAFRNAIDAAINSADFQNAIAANLARIINPRIKDALDTLQPLVESVYSHEVLLRKTNRSVENILDRIDEQASHNNENLPKTPGTPGTPTSPRRRSSQDSSSPQDIEQFRQSLEKSNKRTVATLAELSNAVDTNNKKIEEVVLGIGDLQATLGPTKDNVETIRSSCEQSTTNTAVVQAQLDQLQADIGFVVEAVGTDLGKKVNNINQQVGGHPALLADHATKLDSISTGLDRKVGSVLKAVEAHGENLIEIKDASANPELLAAVQQSNKSHASHALLLGEIKERSLQAGSEPVPAGSVSASGDNTKSLVALEALKTDLAAIGEKIEAELASHNNNLDGLRSKVDIVLSTVEGHKEADQSAEILAAVQMSHELHASHAKALEGVRSIGAEAPPAAPSYDTNFAALEAQMATLHTTIASHTANLDEIKAASSSISREVAPAEESGNKVGELQSKITTIMTKLDRNTDLLSELKDDVSAEILTALHDVGTAQASHGTHLAELREADVSDEILTALHASNDAHSGHSTAFERLEAAVQASNDSHASHKENLEDFKSRSMQSAPPAELGDSSALEAQITALAATLEGQKIALAEIKDATIASNESHAAHNTSLDELKSRSVDVPTAASANTEALETQINAITAALEEHRVTLAEIKAATDFSKDFNISHASSLDEIKSRSVEARPAGSGSTEAFEAQISTLSASLEEQNAALTEIKDATASSNDFHATHASTLDEIKAAALASNNFHAAHAATFEELKSARSADAATLGEIKDGTLASNESHASHTATLKELKTVQPRELPGADDPPTPDLSAFEDHFSSIISTLESQNVTLAGIKESNVAGDVLTSVNRNHELISENHDLISSHTTLLEFIKAESSRADILSGISELKATIEESKSGVDAHGALVKDLHEDTKNAHSALTTSIEALALGGAAGAGAATLVSSDDDKSAEILEEVKAVRTLIETSSASVDTTKETITSIASQIAINHTTVTTSITSLGDELKAEIDATGTQLAESLANLTGNVEAIDIATISSTVDGCATEVKSLATSIEALDEYIHSEGVHFNDNGVSQLIEYASGGERRPTMSENDWFKKPGVTPHSHGSGEEAGEKDYNYLSPVAEEQTPAREESPIPDESMAVQELAPRVEEAPSELEKPIKEPAQQAQDSIFEPPIDNNPIDESLVEESAPATEAQAPVEESGPVAHHEPRLPDYEKETPPEASGTLEKVAEAVPIRESTSDVDEESALAVEKGHSPEPEESKETTLKGKSHISSSPPMTPTAHEVDEASPLSPLSPGGDTEAESASTSTFASPSGPLSPTAPFSPGDGDSGGGKKGKKGKKEKKEKAPKKKKEKIPFTFDGEDPEE